MKDRLLCGCWCAVTRDRAVPSRGRVLSAAMLVLGAVALSASAQASAASLKPDVLPPPPPTCPSVAFIGARGSGESFDTFAGLGPAVDRMAGILSARLATHKLSLQREAVPYPADSVDDLRPSVSELALLLIDPPQAVADYVHDNLGKYARSIDSGIGITVSLAVGTVTDCPRTKLVMAGYSQGAIVMHEAELRLTSSRHRRAVLRHVVGTLLLGDGDRVPFTRAREFGSSAPRAEGIRTYLHAVAVHDVAKPATTANICNAADIVCDFNLSRLSSFSHAAKVHTSYVAKTKHGMRYSPLLTQAPDWLAGRII